MTTLSATNPQVVSSLLSAAQAGVYISTAPAHHFQAATAPASHFQVPQPPYSITNSNIKMLKNLRQG